MRLPNWLARLYRVFGVDGLSSHEGKIVYREDSAKQAALSMAEKKGEPFEAYKCRHCPGFHIGHPPFWGWSDSQKKKAGIQ